MISDTSKIADKEFDYVVIGGGTTGLTVAARLSEDPNVTVLVLEAGHDNIDDFLITAPGQLMAQVGKPEYDWQFSTLPQKHVDGRQVDWNRGRILGGTSAINFMIWNRPAAADINAWEKLGNPGWNWESYLKYSKKGETFTRPPEDKELSWNLRCNPSVHGETGPLNTSFAGLISPSDLAVQTALNNAGIGQAKDPYGGDPLGSFISISTMDPKKHTRAFAAEAYYVPNKDRPNFVVLCGAHVHRILSSGSDGNIVAEQVEFEHKGKIYTTRVRKEAILAAGTLKTPQILELSGIGNRHVLEPLGIQTKVHLPGVGENMQEHFWCPVSFELKPECAFATLDKLRDPVVATEHRELFLKQEGLFRMTISSLAFTPLNTIMPQTQAKEWISKQRRHIEQLGSSIPAGLREQYELQLQALESGAGADIEFAHLAAFTSAIALPESGKAYIAVAAVMNHPFTRGNIHIVGKDPNIQPAMDPRYFEDEFDWKIFVEAVKFVRKLRDVEPLCKLIARDADPGDNCESEDELKKHMKKAMLTAWHTIGTASMLPREKNGVVDSQLRVYGAHNIRIVDLSVVPLHIGAHTQATAYSIAEKAADIIKGGQSSF